MKFAKKNVDEKNKRILDTQVVEGKLYLYAQAAKNLQKFLKNICEELLHQLNKLANIIYNFQ